MKLCVFGAGAIGGHLAARLSRRGTHEVSIVARGEHLRAIRSNGLRLISGDDDFTTRPHAATDRIDELPPQDVVLVTLKAQAQAGAARAIASLLREGGVAVFVSNGIPWWWDWRGEAAPGGSLPLLDPDRALWTEVGPSRAIGCVVYSVNEVVEPGVIRHSGNNEWLLGEPDERPSERVQRVADAMRDADVNGQPVDDLRRRVWIKLLRNVPVNPLCALTRLPIDGLHGVPGIEAMFHALVDETAAVAAAQGVDLADQLARARGMLHLGIALDGSKPRSIKPSMLQDVLAGRTMEVDAILGQVQAFAREGGVATPVLDALVPLMWGLDRSFAWTP